MGSGRMLLHRCVYYLVTFYFSLPRSFFLALTLTQGEIMGSFILLRNINGEHYTEVMVHHG